MADTRKPIIAHFYHWEKTTPDQVFLRQPDGGVMKTYTWKEVGDQARRIATALKNLGLSPNAKVGIFSKNCAHWIIADLAIMLAGYVSAPFYPNLTGEQLNKVLELSDTVALFVGKLDSGDAVPTGVPKSTKTIGFPLYQGNAKVDTDLAWDQLLKENEPLAESPLPALDDLWTILFTSGTTGTPKGVMLNFRTPVEVLDNEKAYGDMGLFELPAHRFFSFLPMNHIAERIVIETACIIFGGTITFAESIDTFAQNLGEARPTLFFAVPRIWTKFQMGVYSKMAPNKLNLLLKIPIVSGIIKKKIKTALGLIDAGVVLTGAAPTPESLKAWYRNLGIELREVYGMTETCGAISLMPRKESKPDTVGKPLSNCEVIIDPATGEIKCRSAWMMQGYYNSPEQTARIMKDGWIHTGDRGVLDADGYLRISGRVSDTFKTAKGKYVVPGPIEWDLAKSELIEQICVAGNGNPQPVALINLSEIGLKEAREQCRARLEAELQRINASLGKHEKVSTLIVLEEPWSIENQVLTPTLKVKRTIIDDRYGDRFLSWHEAPEKIIWETA